MNANILLVAGIGNIYPEGGESIIKVDEWEQLYSLSITNNHSKEFLKRFGINMEEKNPNLDTFTGYSSPIQILYTKSVGRII